MQFQYFAAFSTILQNSARICSNSRRELVCNFALLLVHKQIFQLSVWHFVVSQFFFCVAVFVNFAS